MPRPAPCCRWTRQAGAHQLAVGAEVARSTSDDDQYEQAAAFDASRVTQPVAGEDLEHEVSLRGRSSRFAR